MTHKLAYGFALGALTVILTGMALYIAMNPAFTELLFHSEPFTGEKLAITAPALAKMNDIFDDLEYEYAGSLYGRITGQGADAVLTLDRFDLGNIQSASRDHVNFTVRMDDKYAIVHSHPNGACAIDNYDRTMVTTLKTQLGPQSNLRYTCIQCAASTVICYDLANDFAKVYPDLK